MCLTIASLCVCQLTIGTLTHTLSHVRLHDREVAILQHRHLTEQESRVVLDRGPRVAVDALVAIRDAALLEQQADRLGTTAHVKVHQRHVAVLEIPSRYRPRGVRGHQRLSYLQARPSSLARASWCSWSYARCCH